MNDTDIERFLKIYGNMLKELYSEFASISHKTDPETKQTIIEIIINFQFIKVNVTGDSTTAMMYDISKALIDNDIQALPLFKTKEVKQ